MTNIFGPGHYANTNETATRPDQTATAKPSDTWFTQCDGVDPDSGTNIDDQWLNIIVGTLRHGVRSSGAHQNEISDAMIAEAMARYASGGVFGFCTNVGNSYLVSGGGLFEVPRTLFDGMRLITAPSAANTGAATANVFSTGVKKILTWDGLTLPSGRMQPSRPTAWMYSATADGGAGAWLMLPWAEAHPPGALPSYFRCVRNNQTGIANDAWTKVSGGTVTESQLASGSVMNGTTFTVGAADAGMWFFSFTGIATTEEFVVSIYKNGSRYVEGDGDGYINQTEFGRYVAGAGLVPLAAGNTCELFAYQRNSGSAVRTLATGVWSGAKIRV